MIYPKFVPAHQMVLSKHVDGWQIHCKCGWVSEPAPAGYLKDAHEQYHNHADDTKIVEQLPTGLPFAITGWGRRQGMLGIFRFARCYVLNQSRYSVTVVDSQTGWSGTLSLPITVNAA